MNRHQLLLTLLLLFSAASFSQKRDLTLLLKGGDLNVAENVSKSFCDDFNRQAARYSGKAYALLQFSSIPSQNTRSALLAQGVTLLNFVPNYAYTATIDGDLKEGVLKEAGVRAVIHLAPEQKMHAALPKGAFPNWAVKVPGTIDVWIQFPTTFTVNEITKALDEKNIEVLSTEYNAYNIIAVRVVVNRLKELSAYPFIEYVQPAPAPIEPLNFNSRNGSRSNVLNASVADGGRGLNGEGIVIGIGDNADIQQHVDFTGRLINRSAATHQWHGTHVSGIASGAGIVNEQGRGYAPNATIVSQSFTGILSNAATYVNDYRMVVTNNSYGNIVGCDNNGLYDMYALIMDRMAFELPHLQHVFATGNSGNDQCNPYPKGFGTVLGGFQTAKNMLCVGNTTAAGVISNGSSKGPVRDGRVKPEITAMGTGVLSSVPTNRYGYDNGTSMASPAVSGGLALLYQRYRQLYNDADPKSGLIKALACNGATDKGNRGPDYSYGFGWMNLERSLQMLEKTRFFTGTVAQGSMQNHSIQVPAGTAAVKVMLYWHDPAAALISSRALVHNLDLEVGSTAATTLPQILNATPSAITQLSDAGIDNLNNMEQVTLEQPVAGTYNIRVKGTAVGQNPTQEYFVVYDVIEEGPQLTYPAAGEALVPGEKVMVQWDAYKNSSNPFYLQYSIDGGTSWIDIKSDITGTERQYVWDVPGTTTSTAQVRLQQGDYKSTSGNFTIVGVPAFGFTADQCEGYINLAWNAVAGATGYEVLMLRGSQMTPVATTSATDYSFNSLSKDSIYWVTVRAVVNGKAGRRGEAKSRQPVGGTCAGTMSDHDLKLENILAPVTGRAFTASALGTTAPVTIAVKNLDDAPVTGFSVAYKINNGAWQTEAIAATIAPGATYQHTFTATADLSAIGTYQIVTTVTNGTTDAVTGNDTLKREIKHLPNAPINLAAAFLDDVEAASPFSMQTKTVGLSGLERYDFESSTPFGRVRSFVNSGMAHSGNKTITLDADRTVLTGNTNYLTGTFNLQNYQAAIQDVRLHFQYNHHGQLVNANNKVWIRGSETDPWIVAYDLPNTTEAKGVYKKSRNIELANLLAAAGQEFSSSFAIRWGQFGLAQTTERGGSSGYSIDDIQLFRAVNDLQMLSIVAPASAGCSLTSNTPVSVLLYNSTKTALSAVPVKYRLNNGAWKEAIIPSIAAKDTLLYTFAEAANMATPGEYNLQAVVNFDSDNYRDNDTAAMQTVNSPVISTYPYLEQFELGKGHWYAGGKNSSWAWGTPASEKIKGAASGINAWKTRLVGNYNDNELSYLYSPCFSVSGLQNPTLSFSVALDLEDCGVTLCDGVGIEYSEDGIVWKKLPAVNSTNWVNKTSDTVWSIQNYTRWHVATTALPKGMANLRLRFVMSTDPAVTREGIAVDDIHIYDGAHPVYDDNTITAPVTQNVNGSNWVHFDKDGKRIASVLANNQDLGATEVQAFIFKDSVRSQNSQYYHARNVTIKPFKRDLKDSATVRFYFLDAETDSLVLAKNCATCVPPASAYDLGVSQYSDADITFENGTIRDNHQGLWNFITPQKVNIVPYDKGYYAEFKVLDFSEFWLNAGGLTGTSALPLKLLHFSAKKMAGDVLLQWTTAAEENVDGFDIEVARNSDDVQKNLFQKLGNIAGKGNTQPEQQYLFTDTETFKTGIRYYRLKILERDGSIKYSPVRSVQFDNFMAWQVFPNPSKGIFNFVYQGTAGESVQARVTDLNGRILATYSVQANGQLQKLEVRLTTHPAGIYLLEVTIGQKSEVYKLFRK